MAAITTQEALQDAKLQYHLLMTGQKANVVVDQNGEKVSYTAATASGLLSYIRSLENQLASGSNSFVVTPKAPIRFICS